jgi:hypothetical protein
MTISWTPPAQTNGCPVTEYKLYRNDGEGGVVDTQISALQLAGNPHITEVDVDEFPADHLTKAFKFKVVVFTDHSSVGVESLESAAIPACTIPATPTDAPTDPVSRGTDYYLIVELPEVTVTNG